MDDRVPTPLARLASKLIQSLNKDTALKLDVVAYCLGQNSPVALPGEKPTPEALVPPSCDNRARLLLPLLEKHAPKDVSFVLLLTNDLTLDQEDWQDTEWNKKIKAYSDATIEGWPQIIEKIGKVQNAEHAERVIYQRLVKQRNSDESERPIA